MARAAEGERGIKTERVHGQSAGGTREMEKNNRTGGGRREVAEK